MVSYSLTGHGQQHQEENVAGGVADELYEGVLDVLSCKYVVKHKSAKLLMTYAVGKLEATLNRSHLILSKSSQRVS